MLDSVSRFCYAKSVRNDDFYVLSTPLKVESWVVIFSDYSIYQFVSYRANTVFIKIKLYY